MRLAVIAAIAAALVPIVYFGHVGAVFPAIAAHAKHMTDFRTHPVYLLGRVSNGGWWFYFPVAFAVKTPLGVSVLLLGAFALRRWLAAWTLRDAAFVLVPALVVFVDAMASSPQAGVRFLLPALPFLFVLAGRVATIKVPSRFVTGAASLVPIAATAVSTQRAAPYELTYFNEATGGAEGGARVLEDSNLDWGQGLVALAAYCREQRLDGVYLAYFGTASYASYGVPARPLILIAQSDYRSTPPPDGPLPTRLAVSRYFLDEVPFHGTPVEGLFAWLRARRPLTTLDGSMLVYDVSDARAHVELARMYRTFAQRPRFADFAQWARIEAAAALAAAPDDPDARALFEQ
jgi:hypothetical protein